MNEKERKINKAIGKAIKKIDFVGATDMRGAAQKDFCRIYLDDGSFIVLKAIRGLPEPYVDIDVVEPEYQQNWN